MTPSLTYLFCFVLAISAINTAKLPSYIKPCKVRVPDFKKCAIENGRAAIPTLINGDKEYGVPNFNPLQIPYVEFSSGDLKLNASDIYIRGLSAAILDDVDVDLSKKVITLRGTVPEAILDINYSIGGKLASLPLEGHGTGKIGVYDAVLSYTFEYEEIEKDGLKYIDITKDSFDVVPQKLTIQLDNLFNGNKLLGDNTNKLLNENWPEVLKEFKPALGEIFGKIIKSLIGPVAKRVPLNEIFSDF